MPTTLFTWEPPNSKETNEENMSRLVTPSSVLLLDPERVDPLANPGSFPLTTSSIKPIMRTDTRPKLPKLKFLGDITKSGHSRTVMRALFTEIQNCHQLMILIIFELY